MGSLYSVNSTDGSITTAGAITSTSTTHGFQPPSMTTTQRLAIPTPADGLIVYDTTLHQLWEFQNGSWAEVGGGSTLPGGVSGDIQYNDGAGGFAGAANITTDGSNLTLTDNNKLILGNSNNAYLKYGVAWSGLVLNSDGIGDVDLNAIAELRLWANTASDGSGTYAPGMVFQSNGNLSLLSATGGTVHVGDATMVGTIPSAQLVIDSLVSGFLPPRMTTTQRDAISTPATGLQIYNTTTNQPQVFNGTIWTSMGGGGGGVITQVVYNKSFATTDISSGTFTDTSTLTTITLSDPSHVVEITITAEVSGDATAQPFFTITRNGTNIGQTLRGISVELPASGPHLQTVAFTMIDIPSAVGPLTYTVQGRNDGSGTLTWGYNGDTPNMIVLKEMIATSV